MKFGEGYLASIPIFNVSLLLRNVYIHFLWDFVSDSLLDVYTLTVITFGILPVILHEK